VLVVQLSLTALFSVFVASSARAQTWTNTGIGASLPAMSADGMVIASAAASVHFTNGVFISTNAGLSWFLSNAPTNGSGGRNIESVSVSPDGKAITVAYDVYNSPLYLTTNFGTTWVSILQDTSAAVFSANGTLVSANGFMSTNLGATWIQFQLDGFPLACNADASQLICFHPDVQVDISTNSGKSWTKILPVSDSGVGALTSSADGTHLVAFCGIIGVFTSTNSGASWVRSIPNDSWTGASSIDGSRLAAAPAISSYAAGILFSTNFGQTWATNVPPIAPQRDPIVCSQDGTRWVVTIFGDLCIAYWPPELAIQISGTNLRVSWPAPCTGLVLQETSDITSNNWINVSALPTVINYRNQVVLPATNGPRYFRLVQAPL